MFNIVKTRKCHEKCCKSEIRRKYQDSKNDLESWYKEVKMKTLMKYVIL